MAHPNTLRATPPPLLTLGEAGQYAGVGKHLVGRAIHHGMLECVVYEGRKFVRIDDLKAWRDALVTMTSGKAPQ
jgi:hypothetical protein